MVPQGACPELNIQHLRGSFPARANTTDRTRGFPGNGARIREQIVPKPLDRIIKSVSRAVFPGTVLHDPRLVRALVVRPPRPPLANFATRLIVVAFSVPSRAKTGHLVNPGKYALDLPRAHPHPIGNLVAPAALNPHAVHHAVFVVVGAYGVAENVAQHARGVFVADLPARPPSQSRVTHNSSVVTTYPAVLIPENCSTHRYSPE